MFDCNTLSLSQCRCNDDLLIITESDFNYMQMLITGAYYCLKGDAILNFIPSNVTLVGVKQ